MSRNVMDYALPPNPYAPDADDAFAMHYVDIPGPDTPSATRETINLSAKLRRKYPTWQRGDHAYVGHHIQEIQKLAARPSHPEAHEHAFTYFKSLQDNDDIKQHHLNAIADHFGVSVPPTAKNRKSAVIHAIAGHVTKAQKGAYTQGDDTWQHLTDYKSTPGTSAWLHVPSGQDFISYGYARPVGQQGWMNFGTGTKGGVPRWVNAQTGEFKDQEHDPAQPPPPPKPQPSEATKRIIEQMGETAQNFDPQNPASVKHAQWLVSLMHHMGDEAQHVTGSNEHTALSEKLRQSVAPPQEQPAESSTSAPPSAPTDLQASPQPEPVAPAVAPPQATDTHVEPTPVQAPAQPPVQAAESGLLPDEIGLLDTPPAPPPEERARRMTGKRWSDIDLDGLQEMANAGVPIQDMIDRFDRSEKSVKARLRMLKKAPRPVGDSAGIPDPEYINLLDPPASSTRTKAGVRFEPTTRVADADKLRPEKTGDRLGSALAHDATTGIDPLFFKLANSVQEYTPQGYTPPPNDADDSFSMSPDEQRAKLERDKIKRQGLASGQISGPLRDYTLSLLNDLKSGVHVPEIFSPTTHTGREEWKQDVSTKLAKQIDKFLGESKVDLNEFELSTLAHLAYNRFQKNPSKESLRITPQDIEAVAKHYSPEEIAKRHREFYPQP